MAERGLSTFEAFLTGMFVGAALLFVVLVLTAVIA